MLQRKKRRRNDESGTDGECALAYKVLAYVKEHFDLEILDIPDDTSGL
jgi:hypothetical protein